MEKPCKKLKRLFIILGTTGGVYAGFKYLLPLVAPFFIGYAIALMLRPAARFLAYRVRITFRGKTRRLPVGAAGALLLGAVVLLAGLGISLWMIRLTQEARLLARQLPLWVEELDQRLTGCCLQLEQVWGLQPGSASQICSNLLSLLVRRSREQLMPFLMSGSLALFQRGLQAAAAVLVTIFAAVLSLQEMDELRDRRDRSLFRREFRRIGSRLLLTGKFWFKTQGLILAAVSLVCIAGMGLMGNPYYMIAGAGLGILDALPIFGTGTVLIPWSLICLVQGNWAKALGLFGLYLVCYFLREFMETRMMSSQAGISPLETLAAVYVGLQLFGFFGFILGPLGLLLIEDLSDEWETIDKSGKPL